MKVIIRGKNNEKKKDSRSKDGNSYSTDFLTASTSLLSRIVSMFFNSIVRKNKLIKQGKQ